LIAILNNSQTPVSLKQAALVTLKNYSNDEIGEKVASAYPDRLRADPEVRLSALSLLTSRPIWTQSLLKLVADTRQIHKEDIPSYLVMQMKLSEDPEVSQRVKSIWPELENADETGKEKQYLNTLALINKGSGNAETGKKIFETYCSSCHRLGPMGKDIGPDLSGYDRRNTKDLLYNIIYPNADIREGYVNYLVNLEGGTTVMGSILANEGSNIVIRAASGETVTLPESKIKSMEALEKSLMPEGLLSNLSEKEIQDLFSFLAQEP
ncbi:MAG: c-type cytochrome, partial [Saprospiraceae bacterium]|nr:c-type cytochrome [Saprospiraceae bacterium]